MQHQLTCSHFYCPSDGHSRPCALHLSTDISHLLDNQPPARFAARAAGPLPADDAQSYPLTAVTAVAAIMAGTVLVVSLIFVGNARRLRRGRSQGSMEGVVIQNTDGFTDVSVA